MIRPQHWIVALVIALALHLGVFAYVNFNAPVATAAAEGALGVEIDLGMLGDLGEAEETEQPEEVAPPKPTPPPPPPPPPPPEPPRQQAQAQVREKPKPKPQPPREEEVAPEPAPEQPTANEAVEPGQSENRSQLSRSSGVGSAPTTGGAGGASTDYKSKIAAQLARHKRYPSASRRRREEGVATLSFVIQRDGSVTGAEIRQSSGYARLDRAVIQMLERASPFPPFPDDMPEQQLALTIPVNFQVVNGR